MASSPSIGNSWQAARELAQARGGELAAFGSRSASLHGSLAEWNHVSTTIIFADGSGPVHRTMFLGGRLVDGQWTWVDGSPWPGDAPWFSPGVCDGVPSPNGDGSVLQSFCYGLFWDDRPLLGGGALDKALVEWSEDCNADGTVDYGQILRGQLADADSNGIPDVCETDACPGDVDESGSVDSADLNAVLLTWGTDGGKLDRADCDRNGTVDAMDLALVLNGWGECPTR